MRRTKKKGHREQRKKKVKEKGRRKSMRDWRPRDFFPCQHTAHFLCVHTRCIGKRGSSCKRRWKRENFNLQFTSSPAIQGLARKEEEKKKRKQREDFRKRSSLFFPSLLEGQVSRDFTRVHSPLQAASVFFFTLGKTFDGVSYDKST